MGKDADLKKSIKECTLKKKFSLFSNLKKKIQVQINVLKRAYFEIQYSRLYTEYCLI